jgi:hypothetical protein
MKTHRKAHGHNTRSGRLSARNIMANLLKLGAFLISLLDMINN